MLYHPSAVLKCVTDDIADYTMYFRPLEACAMIQSRTRRIISLVVPAIDADIVAVLLFCCLMSLFPPSPNITGPHESRDGVRHRVCPWSVPTLTRVLWLMVVLTGQHRELADGLLHLLARQEVQCRV